MKRTTIRPVLVDLAPREIEEGILYVSQKYKAAVHKCCCGCGEKVVTPLSPAHWQIRITNEAVTLHPSVGNWGMACKSHYWIKNNRVVWAGKFSDAKIEAARKRDSADQRQYINQVNRQKEGNAKPQGLRDWIKRLISGK